MADTMRSSAENALRLRAKTIATMLASPVARQDLLAARDAVARLDLAIDMMAHELEQQTTRAEALEEELREARENIRKLDDQCERAVALANKLGDALGFGKEQTK